jgi:hypothetical protein
LRHRFIKRCEIRVKFIDLYFIHQHIYSCVKHVFNTWYLCEKCTNLWMNELCIISLLTHHMLNLWCIKGEIYKWTYFSTHEPSTHEYSHVHTLFHVSLSFDGLNSQDHHWFNKTYLDANCLVCVGKENTLNMWSNHMQ